MTTSSRVQIVESVFKANDDLADANRELLDHYRIFGINIMASPGAGKTSVILKTINALKGSHRMSVIEGDTAPVTIDADKVHALGIPAVQVNTGGDCHLDAGMIRSALNVLPVENLDVLVIENVGNLVCPASFRLGTHRNVLIASIPEGDDKPYKYPGIYRGVDALVLNKIDLLPYIDFRMTYFLDGVRMLNPTLATFPLSCKTGEGFSAWIDWITTTRDEIQDA